MWQDACCHDDKAVVFRVALGAGSCEPCIFPLTPKIRANQTGKMLLFGKKLQREEGPRVIVILRNLTTGV